MLASRIVIAAFAGLCSISAFAQIPAAQTNTTNTTNGTVPQTGATGASPGAPQNTNPRNTAQDTSVPDANRANPKQGDTTDATANQSTGTNPKSEGPEIVDDPNATPEQKASAEYSGPAVLSRGISASEPMNPKNVKFVPYVGLEFIVNSGLTGVALQPNGQLGNNFSPGAQLSYGITGTKLRKKDMFSLSFSGNIYHYSQASNLDGTDDELSLTWSHRLSRHLTFGLNVQAQEYNRNNLLISGADFINSGIGTTLVTATPATEVFDGRVFTLMTQANVTYHVNARLSLNMTGAGFLTRRASSSLYGNTGSQAGADLAYRLTRRVTVGSYYSFTHFDFIGIYGGSDINTLGAIYSIAFNRRTQLSARVGASRLETTAVEAISLDPVIAKLLGTQTVLSANYLVNYFPDVGVEFRRQVSNFAASVAYTRGITPGNGIILTSIRQNVSFGIDYLGRGKWGIKPTFGYDGLAASGASSQRYSSVFAGINVSRKLYRNFDWHFRYDYHYYTFDNTGFLRNSNVLSTGIRWSPSDLFRLW